MEKRIIALDIGEKRIGVAVTDPFNEYALPSETYWRTGSWEADLASIVKIIEEKGVGTIVCGLPLNADGTESIQTVRTQRFIDALRERTTLPIVTEDERYTTLQARQVQIAGGVKRKNRKNSIDSIAASYILENYLANRK